jgi:hypothetical protein
MFYINISLFIIFLILVYELYKINNINFINKENFIEEIKNYSLLLSDKIWKQAQELTNNTKDLNTVMYNITDKFKILNTIMNTKQSDMLVFELSKHVGVEIIELNNKLNNIIKKILDDNEDLITIIYPSL